MGACLLKYRFFILCLILFVLMVFQTINGQWAGDFWEHASVVRELATHPFSPRHPVLLLNAPHLYYSPYDLGIALISRITGLEAVTTLSVAAIANLLFFLFGLRLFVSALFPENREATSFYAVLFVLFLWGMSQYSASGFFNLVSLSYAAPYPSTFSASMVFMALAMWIRLVRNDRVLWIIPVAGIAGFVLLSHPLTYILLAVGLVAIVISEHPRFGPVLWLTIFVFAVSLLAAATWPYYPFFTGVLSESEFISVSKAASLCFYDRVPLRILPTLAGVPVIIYRMASNWRDPLGLMFVMLLIVYGFSAIFGEWMYGRVLSPIALTLQIALAAAVAQGESRLSYRKFFISFQQGMYCLVVVLFSLTCSAWYFPYILQHCKPDSPSVRNRFTFLSKFVPQDDVVLSDWASSWVVPTFGGKVVAPERPQAFVPDNDQRQRRKDVNVFFSSKSDYDTRLAIVRKYGCRHILVSKENGASGDIIRSFLPLGAVVYEDNRFVLLSLGPHHAHSDSPGIASFGNADSSHQ
jgi:hypothetical protein